ncbi:hypothetical protein Tco_0942654, partial [Tanacetum coccineum]
GCNNKAILPNIPCLKECRIVGQLLVDHALSYALTATADVLAMYIQQFWKTVRQVPNANETIRFIVYKEEITYTVDMFHDTLKLLVQTPKQPFIPLADFDYIYPFQGHLHKQKKNVIQYPLFTKLIITNLIEKYELIPKRLKEDFHTIKDDTMLVNAYKDYVEKFERVEVPMIQPELIESTQGMHRTPRATRIPNLDVVQTRKRKDKTAKVYEAQQNLAAVKENVLEENMDKIVEGEDDLDGTEFADTKDDKKIDDDDDDHNDHTLIKIQVTGSSEITTKKIQTPIPSPPRSHRTDLSSDKENDQELMQMKKKYVTNNHLQDIKEKVNESLKDIAPKLATTTTIDLTNDDLPRIVANDVKKERESLQLVVHMKLDLQAQVVDLKLWDVLKSKFEKSSTSSCSCKNYAFRKRNHDEHQGDDAPPKGDRSSKRHKMSKSSKSARVIDKDEVILEDETPELIDEFQNVDNIGVYTTLVFILLGINLILLVLS